MTRIPLPGAKKIVFTPQVITGSMVFYPLVGLFYSLVTVGLWIAGRAIGLESDLAALVILAAPYLINRFLHFDGLCDVLDGFLADRTPEQRLVIMKDSRNGSFAMGGAILALLAKYLLIRQLCGSGDLLFLTMAPVIVRWLVVVLAFKAVYPRSSGTSVYLVGQVSVKHLILTTLVALGAIALLLIVYGNFEGFSYIPWWSLGLSMGLTLFWLGWLRWVSKRKIGGVTGDVLGCFIELGEVTWFVGGALL